MDLFSDNRGVHPSEEKEIHAFQGLLTSTGGCERLLAGESRPVVLWAHTVLWSAPVGRRGSSLSSDGSLETAPVHLPPFPFIIVYLTLKEKKKHFKFQ